MNFLKSMLHTVKSRIIATRFDRAVKDQDIEGPSSNESVSGCESNIQIRVMPQKDLSTFLDERFGQSLADSGIQHQRIGSIDDQPEPLLFDKSEPGQRFAVHASDEKSIVVFNKSTWFVVAVNTYDQGPVPRAIFQYMKDKNERHYYTLRNYFNGSYAKFVPQSMIRAATSENIDLGHVASNLSYESIIESVS